MSTTGCKRSTALQNNEDVVAAQNIEGGSVVVKRVAAVIGPPDRSPILSTPKIQERNSLTEERQGSAENRSDRQSTRRTK